MDVGRPGRISVEDIIFLIRKDPKKYSRVKELLLMNEELRKARKAFDEVKYVSKWEAHCSVLGLNELVHERSGNFSLTVIVHKSSNYFLHRCMYCVLLCAK